MTEIAEQFARRDRLRKHLYGMMSESERMQRMDRLQRNAWETLQSSPGGMKHFWARNLAKRAVSLVVN